MERKLKFVVADWRLAGVPEHEISRRLALAKRSKGRGEKVVREHQSRVRPWMSPAAMEARLARTGLAKQ